MLGLLSTISEVLTKFAYIHHQYDEPEFIFTLQPRKGLLEWIYTSQQDLSKFFELIELIFSQYLRKL